MGSSQITGLILCGGESKRYGTDKALDTIDETAMIDHAIAQLKPHCDRIVLLAGRNPHRFWSRLDQGVEVSSDPGEGPAEALRYWLCENAKRSLVIAVDMPLLTARDLGGFVNCAPPGCSILGDSRATLPCIVERSFLETKDASLRACFKALRAARINPADLGIDPERLKNFNRPPSQQE